MLVSAVQQRESAVSILLLPPSWDSLPPPQPSGLSQSNELSSQDQRDFLGMVRGSAEPLTTYFSFPHDTYCMVTKRLFSLCKTNYPKLRVFAFFHHLISYQVKTARASYLGSFPLNPPHLAHPPWHSQTTNTSLMMTIPCLSMKGTHSHGIKFKHISGIHGLLDLASAHFSTFIFQQFHYPECQIH